jgi:alkaline phosphatase D
MSAPRRRKPRQSAVSRRDFFKRASRAGVALAIVPMLPGCGSGLSTEPIGVAQESASVQELAAVLNAVTFKHGVASGDPQQDRVILWTRVTPTGEPGSVLVSYVVATDPELLRVVMRGSTTTNALKDYTVKVDPTGLSAGTTYFYRFSVGAVNSAIGRTKTLPSGDVSRLKIAVVSCSSLSHGLFNAYGRVAERADLDVVVHLGDYIYEYGTDQYGSARAYEPAGEIVTLSDYRQRHAQYKRDPDLMALHSQHAMINVWDDHETADNSYRDGANNHNAGEGDWNTRVAAALQALYEWMPIRQTSVDLRKNFRTFRIGNLVDLVMLETRLVARDLEIPPAAGLPAGVFAQQGAFTDPARTLLGTEQETWFLNQLRTSTAKWRLVGQQVMFGQLKVVGAPNALGTSLYLNPDQWDGYAPARARIHAALAGDGTHPAINNVVILTGDIHTSWAMDITPDPNNPTVYNPLTGVGSLAVEFVATSVTSPGLDQLQQVQDAIRAQNPHIKYVDLAGKGYLLLDITPERVNGEFWYVDTIAKASASETFAKAYAVVDGQNHLTTSSRSS